MKLVFNLVDCGVKEGYGGSQMKLSILILSKEDGKAKRNSCSGHPFLMIRKDPAISGRTRRQPKKKTQKNS
jgi:hypothetical protein